MPAKYLGRCWACEYYPVAFDAPACPRCGVKNPNPSRGERYSKQGALLGVPIGALIGGLLFAIVSRKDWQEGFLAGSFLGMVPGFVLGNVIGKIVGSILGDSYEPSNTNRRYEDDRYSE